MVYVRVDPTRRWSGDRLRAARLAAGLSPSELAAAAGSTDVSVWRWESNRSAPSLGAVIRIIDQLGVDLDALTEPVDDADDLP
jgi:transcriptional regulator with XRE-family HTH domain